MSSASSEFRVPNSELPRAAYIHVPFCAHRCGYCNFTLVAGRGDLVESFLRALQLELQQLERPREVDTLYIGGGTPTQLTAAQLARLLDLVQTWFPPAPNSEVTIEANPADVTRDQLETLTQHRVNRISLGAQSFDDDKLRTLERDHTPRDIHRAVQLARQHDLQVALDLIFAAPGETLDVWQADLAAALAVQPEHLSTYGLTYERGTAFWTRRNKGTLAPVAEDAELAMYETAIDTLVAAGYEHYEISNFARPGRRSRHNQVYWTGGGYYAAGPGAARYVDGVRETNHRSTTTYLKRVLAGESPVADRETLDPEEAARERLVFGLRRLEGIDLAAFQRQTGYNALVLAGQALEVHLEAGRISKDGKRLRLTRQGLMVSDSIWPDIL